MLFSTSRPRPFHRAIHDVAGQNDKAQLQLKFEQQSRVAVPIPPQIHEAGLLAEQDGDDGEQESGWLHLALRLLETQDFYQRDRSNERGRNHQKTLNFKPGVPPYYSQGAYYGGHVDPERLIEASESRNPLPRLLVMGSNPA
ncbi:hypothetical protein CPLU01_05227 [Colletotrichum plurivorum]|uniref:Uncharacterized protein n=1 Tax=Colletotrichum plurivorum TaxID=2175906 RepID=A0A8H6KLX4_9PEZI|nr:hypothetical protein CPLU01_05227 [Colletotrichum plurivorum]